MSTQQWHSQQWHSQQWHALLHRMWKPFFLRGCQTLHRREKGESSATPVMYFRPSQPFAKGKGVEKEHRMHLSRSCRKKMVAGYPCKAIPVQKTAASQLLFLDARPAISKCQLSTSETCPFVEPAENLRPILRGVSRDRNGEFA